MEASYSRIAARGLERIGALSDGVFAIAMTLIVLEIHVPQLPPGATDGDLWSALWMQGHSFVTFALSS
jgi:uncharacterized membrane protein